MKKIVLIISSLLMVCSVASAQGALLKKLGDKAVGAAVKKTSSWASAKSMAATLNGLIISYTAMPHLLYDCPLVRHAWED